MLGGSEAGGSNAAIALLPQGMRLTIIFCILLFSMSFVENFATSIASCTVRLGAFRRVAVKRSTFLQHVGQQCVLMLDKQKTHMYDCIF